MTYTVKQLAKLSGMSIRSLRFYDEIGLLKPAFVGENKYRYYQEEQLFILQQILFYRELGFSLADIQKVINTDDFNKVDALISHKKILAQSLHKTKQLIDTIDKTLAHLKGDLKMNEKELYYGFDSAIQKEHEKHLVEKGIVSQTFLDDCNKKIKEWSDEEKNAFLREGEGIMTALIITIKKDLAASCPEVQDLIHKHYLWLKRSWSPTQESYLGLVDLYQTPEFRKFFDVRHPKLLQFLVEAMKIYAANELSRT